MPMTDTEARAILESDGLLVRPRSNGIFLVGTALRDDAEIRLLANATSVYPQGEQWAVSFPAIGSQVQVIPGNLDQLVPLIRKVYAQHRREGGDLSEAVTALTGPFKATNAMLQGAER